MTGERKRSPASVTDGQIGKKTTRRSAFWTGVLLGIGIIAFLDETIIHQLLQWHTFYWNTDQHGRILSDGLFHLFSTLLLLWGTVGLWQGRDTWAPAAYQQKTRCRGDARWTVSNTVGAELVPHS